MAAHVQFFVIGRSMSEVLKPPASLLCKLGSIVVHVEEMLSDDGHEFDKAAIESLLKDYEVAEWLVGMEDLAMLPVKRTSR